MGRRSIVTNMMDPNYKELIDKKMHGPEYDQTVNGVHYVIKPGQSIELDRHEAIELVGFYPGPKIKCNLKITHLPDKDAPKPELPKMWLAPDGKEFLSKEACMEYIKTKGK
jgi:hypothetical protein